MPPTYKTFLPQSSNDCVECDTFGDMVGLVLTCSVKVSWGQNKLSVEDQHRSERRRGRGFLEGAVLVEFPILKQGLQIMTFVPRSASSTTFLVLHCLLVGLQTGILFPSAPCSFPRL